MSQNKEHQKLVNEILLAVGSMPNIRLWKRVVGYDLVKKIKYGLPGEADLDGIIGPHGRKLCIEVKTGTGRLSSDQKAYRDMVIKFGALYIEARSVETVLKALQDFRGGTDAHPA